MPQGHGISHLLILTPGFPGSEAETDCLPAVQQFILAYRKTYPAVSVTIFTVHYPHRQGEYQWHGCRVYAWGNSNKGGVRKAMTVMKLMSRAKHIHASHPFNAVLSFWLTDTALIAKMLAKRVNIPYLVWMHGQDAKAGNKYVRRIKADMERLAAISALQKTVFEQAYGSVPAHVIPNGINEDCFPRLNMQKRKIDLLAVGSLTPLKQYHLFVDVVSHIKRSGFDTVNAILVGEGETEPALRRRIAEAGLDRNITLTGKIQHARVLELMNEASIFVHTSSYEGHSTVMLEALYSGCNVVSFLPAGEGQIVNFYPCADLAGMQDTCLSLCRTGHIYSRVKVSDMTDSARQVQHILTSMVPL